MKAVFSTTSPTEAQGAQVRLDAHGIESVLENEGGAYYAIGFPSPLVPLVVSVRDEDAEEARRVLAEERPSPTAEDAEFREQVRLSREAARRGWLLVVAVLLGIPVALPALALLLPGRDYPPLVASLAAAIGIVVLVFGLRALMRRRPT